MSDAAILARWAKILAALFFACVLLLAYVAWLKDWDLERRIRDLEAKQKLQIEWNKKALGVQ